MEIRTIYTVKGKNIPVFWEIHFDLNGDLREFKFLEESEMSEKLSNWLFHPKRFPYTEEKIKSWEAVNNLEIVIGQPDISFDVFWSSYRYKFGKVQAEKAWKRLNKIEQWEAVKQIKAYDGYLRRRGIEKAYPATYLNQKKFNDRFNSV